MKKNTPSYLEIDCDRLDHNITAIRRSLAPDVQLCCVVKADAYSLGAAPIAARLNRLGVEMLAVFTLDQARELIQAGINTRILLLMPLRKLERHDLLYRALISNKLECVVHDAQHLTQLTKIADTFGSKLSLHVEVDTGMSRGGMTPAQAKPIINSIINHRRLHLAGIMTHFACADEPQNHSATENQFQQFVELVQQFDEDLLQTTALHIANTHAAFNFGKRFHFDLVRLGIAWVGYGNQDIDQQTANKSNHHPQLKPIVRWLSKIIHTKWIEPNTPVGYGSTFHAKRKTRLGLIPVGYADGYPVALSNKAIVRVQKSTSPSLNQSSNQITPQGNIPFPTPQNHQQPPTNDSWFNAPVIGRVSMDQIIIDLTDLPENQVNLDTTVELLSNDPAAPNSLPALAQLAQTIPYEILCGISPRIPRQYLDRQRRLRTTLQQDAEINANPRQTNHSPLSPAPLTTTR